MKRFDRVRQILEEAVGGQAIAAHGNFWRGTTIDAFKAKKVFGRQLLVVGNAQESNLIRALEGRAPFGSDIGTNGALFKRMPADRPALPADRITFIRSWIDAGCPDDDAPAPNTPARHNDYWRDFDNWSMFESSPEVEGAIGVFFNVAPTWMAVARALRPLSEWTAAIARSDVTAALALLGGRVLATVHSHYGDPIVLGDLLESYELFGSDRLPDDALRPADPRHNMNGETMWFFLAAFVDAQLRGATASPGWASMGRAVLLGLLNDGLFRGRFTVVGMTPDADGSAAARALAVGIEPAALGDELARRFSESGLGR